MKSITLHPHAKINLGLQILGRRSDGYHSIRTVFQTVDLFDEMEISLEKSELSLVVEGMPLPPDRPNLVLKAAAALRDRQGRVAGARIRLLKRIPVGAGLGGGSSDAALSLLGLNRLWNLSLSIRELSEIASRLGADVPFFLCGGTALGEGVGERIRPLPDIGPYRVCLIVPSFPIPTAEMYRRWDEAAGGVPRPEEAFEAIPHGTFPRIEPRSIANDFQPLVFSLYPELQGYLERLYLSGAMAASLSGSGSSLFGLFKDDGSAEEVSRAWDWGNVAVRTCSLASRAAYCQRLGVDLPFLDRKFPGC